MEDFQKELEALRAAFKPKDPNQRSALPSQYSNWYSFNKMEVGKRVVLRFVPDLNPDNVRKFIVERNYHEIMVNGKMRRVPCLHNFKEKCPICELSAQFYKSDDKENGKKYYKVRRYLTQALIVEDPLPPDESGSNSVGKLKIVQLSPQIYKVMMEAITSEDEPLDAPVYHPKYGYDFVIKKNQATPNDYPSYVVGTKFLSRPRELTDAELLEMQEKSVDLSTLLQKNPGRDKLAAMLSASINGEEYHDRGEDYSDHFDQSKPTAPIAPAAKPAPTPVAAPVASITTDDDDDVDAIIAQIRQNRGQ